ncbi:shikimate kinase [Paenibacillus sp. YN15]|uniref:shikimate kinase n=1 Tax=Paenibacillus sp. YN15 TaxID=1742774 RepID=UPI000DCB24D1|nr:shikimate kinase [Paenibacillus sp. YN15]RAV04560.1 shikimate kinase [Paenibacillus sp. YN15]
MQQNIVLVGFMGTGKTTVGRILAERLGWTFTDTDAYIEEQAGMTISRMFQEHGEAYFRERETESLRELLQRQGQVVSTGGGAVLREENRRLMLENGLVVAMLAEEAVIVQRVKGDAARPLLQGDLEERVRTLVEARRHAYDFAHAQLHTDNLSPLEAARRIQEMLDA